MQLPTLHISYTNYLGYLMSCFSSEGKVLPVSTLLFMVLIVFLMPSRGYAQLPHGYVDHTPYPQPPGDSCNWFVPNEFGGLPVDSCDCGSLYPKGPDYQYSRMGGRNYDPSYDTCLIGDPYCKPPVQVDHVFKVPCEWTTDPQYGEGYQGPVDVQTGCFTLSFNLTQCQEGKTVQQVEITLRDQDKNCRNPQTHLGKPDTTGSVTLYDTVYVGTDTIITSRDSLIINPNVLYTFDEVTGSTVTLNLLDPPTAPDGPLGPAPPCESRSFQFEVCDLWSWGHGPAEQDCPTVLEIKLINSDGTECGIIPFPIVGSCQFPDPTPGTGGGGDMERRDLFVPSVGELEVQFIRYDGYVLELQ